MAQLIANWSELKAMHPLFILLIGMAVVLGGIVYFRWHAFLALVAATIAIALLTSKSTIQRHELRDVATVLETEDLDADRLKPRAIASRTLVPERYVVLREVTETGGWLQVGVLQLTLAGNDEVTISQSGELRAGDQLVTFGDWKRVLDAARESVGKRVVAGFGDTCRKIGLLIAMAAIIGHCLMRSGGAERIIQAFCALVGDARASLGFVASGFVLGIPVFFDTVFYLLIPLAKALYRRTGKNYLLYVMSVVVGATMAHSLVPPTPGPLLVASEMKIDIGMALKAGLIVGAISATAGYLFSMWLNRRQQIVPELSDQTDNAADVSLSDDRLLPPLWLSLLPILLPLILLASGAEWSELSGNDGSNAAIDARQGVMFWDFVSDKNIALTVSAAVALLLLAVSPRRDQQPLAQHVQQALAEAGSIILITAAGGALGQVIRQTDIAGVLADLMPTQGASILVLLVAFVVTALIRFMQGSATVAMITAVGIVGPLASVMDMSFHPVYLFLAIGCGSKPLPWMNDSGFWVVGRMSGMTPTETLRSFSTTLTVMGCVGFAVTLLGALFLPLR